MIKDYEEKIFTQRVIRCWHGTREVVDVPSLEVLKAIRLDGALGNIIWHLI